MVAIYLNTGYMEMIEGIIFDKSANKLTPYVEKRAREKINKLFFDRYPQFKKFAYKCDAQTFAWRQMELNDPAYLASKNGFLETAIDSGKYAGITPKAMDARIDEIIAGANPAFFEENRPVEYVELPDEPIGYTYEDDEEDEEEEEEN